MYSVLEIVIHKLISFMTHRSWKKNKILRKYWFLFRTGQLFIHFHLLLCEKHNKTTIAR